MSARRFRKKPIEVKAMQWVPEMADSYVQSIFDWLRAGRAVFRPATNNALWLLVDKGQSECLIHSGDWIIAEPDGKGFYPCSRDQFDATYEPVEPRPESGGSG